MFADAKKAARRSSLYKFRTGAALYDRKGKLLSIGWSHRHEHWKSVTPWSKHAEVHAIERLTPDKRKKVHTIVIVTLNKSNRMTAAMPCEHCAKRIHRCLPNVEALHYTEYLRRNT